MHKNTLKQVLDDQGRKQAWLGEQVGLNKDAISRLVTGKHLPNLRTAQKIAEVLGKEINELWPIPREDEFEGPKS